MLLLQCNESTKIGKRTQQPRLPLCHGRLGLQEISEEAALAAYIMWSAVAEVSLRNGDAPAAAP
jgi:hypothetical protein